MAKQKLLTAAIRKALPILYAQEELGDKAIVHAKFFTPDANWTWWATEASAFVEDGKGGYDQVALGDLKDEGPFGFCYQGKPIEDIRFFGLVNGNDKEYGYFSYNELNTTRAGSLGRHIERDTHWVPVAVGDLL